MNLLTFYQVAQSNIDYEEMKNLTLTVRCYDDGSPSLSIDKTFTIVVLDQNEVPTGLNMTGGQVDENLPAGQLVAKFTTSDPDNEFTVRQVGHLN